jgi:hypothetical protein
MSGYTPTELGLLTNLEQLLIAGNLGLMGSIPNKLDFMTPLTLLDVSKTSLEGSVSDEI